ncbi:hypothetical protein Q7P36_006926 [Cladosporium allicinum]
MANTEIPSRLQTVTFDYGEQRASLTVLCERTEFMLQASPSSLIFPQKDLTYQQLLGDIKTATEPGKYRNALESLRNAVLTPFLPTIQNLATRFDPGKDLTVSEWAECNRFHLSLQPSDQIMTTKQNHSQLSHGLVSLPMSNITLPSNIPQFDTSEITLASYDSSAAMTGTWPDKATAAGKTYFFKAAIDLRYPEFENELATYVALHNLGNPVPRIPVLTGVVVTPSPWLSEIDVPAPTETMETGPFILGFLISWIDNAVILADVSRQDRALYMVEWRATVRETVRNMHSLGILWGDVNAHNVVVDREMDAWVVDFGRGGKGAKEQLSSGDDGDGGARRKLEMEKELEGIDAMMEVLLSLGPEDSRGLGPFYLHEG